MAKKALFEVLEQTIGKYVRNLDAESLNVAVWSGKIELNTLELDVDSVNAELNQRSADAPNLALPFRVLSGRFESFQVDVPWAHITSRPVVLRARGLSVEVEPIDRRNPSDAVDTLHMNATGEADMVRMNMLKEAREKMLESSNKFRLQAYNMKKIALAEEHQNQTQDQGSNSTFTSRLIRRIIENIQIEIKDVHVSLTDADGSVGACLSSLRLVTTDNAGEQVFVDRTRISDASLEMAFLYKMLRIEGLGIYLDEEEFKSAKKSLQSIGELNSDEDDDIFDQFPSMDHAYILAPLSFEAKLRQADSNICIEYAKYHLRSQLSSLSILLNRSQLDFARKIAKVMTPQNPIPQPLFPEYRPLVRIQKGTAKEWWRYAVRCIGRLNGRRSWVEFFLAYKKRKQYIPLFKRLAHHSDFPWIKPLSSKEMDLLIEIEQDRSISIEGLMAWRNIADAQFDRERQKIDAKQKSKAKSNKSSYYSYLFGSSSADQQVEDDATDTIEEVAVTLSDEEMRELEEIAVFEHHDTKLSKDSRLYDFEFVMKSFKVDLVAYDLKHIARLEMGQVSTSFNAAMDGGFTFDFELTNLEIFDRATPQSIFPSVLKMIDQPSSMENTKAFVFNLSKSSTGDQSLKMRIAAFEAVASQLMVQEIQRFFRQSSQRGSSKKYRKANPLLAQSISGSVDLFYDAQPGESFVIRQETPTEVQVDAERKPTGSRYDLSNALIDAWKEKTAARASWMIDVDIHAPVILIPESCNDPKANVLVFDLGNFRLNYGKYRPSSRIQQWFKHNPRETLNEETYDSGTLSVSDLTFAVQKARLWRSGPSTSSQTAITESAIIDPTGVSIEFAIETIGSEGDPRFCVLGVIPTISVTISPSQSSRIFPVISSWSDSLKSEPGDPHDISSDDSWSEPLASVSEQVITDEVEASIEKLQVQGSDGGSKSESYALFYCKLGLQHLALTLVDEGSKQLEAHLVSVYASLSSSSDKSSIAGLQMGWFWILDWMENENVRRQRLLVHSNLPYSAEKFSSTGDYNVLSALRQQGVFEADYHGSTDLADVTYRTLSQHVADSGEEKAIPSSQMLDAKFQSFFLHWNPQTVKGVNALIVRFATAVDDDQFSNTGTLILSPTKTPRRGKDLKPIKQPRSSDSGELMIRAQMESLNVILNSALDDLPLFSFTFAGTSVSVVPRGSGQEMFLSLGDIRIATESDAGRTLPEYRTLLGLASGSKESLLTVRYCSGFDAVNAMDFPVAREEKMEAVATINLSPMRFCYIQSQVLTLMEYATDGILGAITAQAATTAAEAAKELANSVSGGSMFTIRATSLDLFLPQGAYREQHLRINAASLDVNFKMFGDARGSHVDVVLSRVVLKDANAVDMQEEPIKMLIEVSIPLYGVGDEADQAMHIRLDLSKASFVLTKAQYAQIVTTLNENIGETSLFLRDEDISGLVVETSEGTTKSTEMTHAGAEFDGRTRRLNMVVAIKELSLGLRGRSREEPIVQIRAVNASVTMSQCPDVCRSSMVVSLQDLFCEDCRQIAQFRQYRYLVDQTHASKADENESIFRIQYTSEDDKSYLDFALGSPRVVLIPDVISEIVSFTNVNNSKADSSLANVGSVGVIDEDQAGLMDVQVIRLNSFENGEVIETHLRSSESVFAFLTARTGNCRFVLVDLGSQLSADREASQDGSTASTTSASQLPETIVLQGVFSGSWSSETNKKTGESISAEFQAHSDGMEIFTAFGSEMRSPLQILEPAKASVHGSLRTIASDETQIEVRAAALTPMDFCLSMHDVALLCTLSNSLSASFRYAEEKEAADAAEDQQLSLEEQRRIEHLANALEKLRGDESASFQDTASNLEDSVAASSFHLSESKVPTKAKYQIKLTMPQTSFTVINDLQGLDEALFRLSVTNFVAGGEFISPKTLFDFHCNTSLLADYFDSSVNLWSRLLINPWEVTMKGSRAPSRRFKSNRLSSNLDLESFPCCISFSEQFLVSLASAARMWSIYAAAVHGPAEDSLANNDSMNSRMMTASAARNLITSFPHAVANHSGVDVTFSLKGGSIEDQVCPTGNVQYFRFNPPKGRGYGGRRVYGQDVKVQKLVEIKVDKTIIVVNMDVELGLPASANLLENYRILFTYVVKEGKTTVLHLTTHVEVVNQTLLPIDIGVVSNGENYEVGTCFPKINQSEATEPSELCATSGMDTKKTKSFSIPIFTVEEFYKDWESYGSGTMTLLLSPLIPENEMRLTGTVDLSASLIDLKRSSTGFITTKLAVTCRSQDEIGRCLHPFALQVSLLMKLVADEHVFLIATLEPRAVVQNETPVTMSVQTPMPQTYSTAKMQIGVNNDVTYDLESQARIEVFTPGPSIAITVRPHDKPVSGNELGWIDAGWVDLPLAPEFSLQDPIVSSLPFVNETITGPSSQGSTEGAEVYIVEGRKELAVLSEAHTRKDEESSTPTSPRSRQVAKRDKSEEGPLSFFLTVTNYGVDHTGSVLFEQVVSAAGQHMRTMSSLWQSEKGLIELGRSNLYSQFLDETELFEGLDPSRRSMVRRDAPRPLGAYSSSHHRKRITLLSRATAPLRLLSMTMDGDEGLKLTMPFLIEDLPIGGAAAVPIYWEDRTPSGYFVYRSIVNSYQSQIHIVPEFIVFNGSKNVLLVKENNVPEVIVEPGETGQLRTYARSDGLKLLFNFIELECHTSPLRVGKVGLRVAMVRSYDGTPVGSVYVQTVADTHGDARLVVKVGDVKFGSLGAPSSLKQHSFFGEDFCRFRVRWTELQLILNEVSDPSELGHESWNIRKLRNQRNQSPHIAFNKLNKGNDSPSNLSSNRLFSTSPQNRTNGYKEIQIIQQPIMAMIFSRFTVDFQRVFKEGDKKSHTGSLYNSPERSQISVIVHNVQIKDLTPDSVFPMVFDCSSDISFFDLCVRIRGPLNVDMVKVDLFDLNLAHSNGRSEKMVLTTSEAYIWRILDLVNRILRASGEVGGFALKFEDDSEHGGYVIKIEDFAKTQSMDSEKYKYSAPKVDTLYDIALTRVSPFTVVVSFRRSPEMMRYSKVSDAPGAAIANYFTRKLKFTIDKAELHFARYEDRNLKGPPDRLLESLSTVYMGRMKFKVVSLLSAASLQDWRYLAGRDSGDDEYVEGDILRATGNLAGKSAGTVVKIFGRGVGGAVAGVSSFVGDGIEDGASKIGARRLGSGVSSVVTGVGYGVGDTLSGVGTGAGKIIQGAGQGVGHVFGGLSGGALQIGKGIGKGITTGDTKAVRDGFTRGASSVGGGLSQGAESAVMGAADGIFSAGKGIFSGVKNVGQGIGGAIRGKKPPHFQRKKQQDDNSSK